MCGGGKVVVMTWMRERERERENNMGDGWMIVAVIESVVNVTLCSVNLPRLCWM